MLTPQQILDEIEALPAEAKAEVVDLLLHRYDPHQPPEDVSPELLAMLRERVADYRAGRVESIPSEQVFKEMDDLLKE